MQMYGRQMIAVAGTLLGTWLGYKLKAQDEAKSKQRRFPSRRAPGSREAGTGASA